MDLAEIARLMEANLLQVFNERDPARRREVIARTYTANVRWTDDDGTTVGHDALNTKAQQLHDGPLAGLVFVKKVTWSPTVRTRLRCRVSTSRSSKTTPPA